MPVVIIWALGGAAIGGLLGFNAGGGTDAIARAAKWAAIGTAVYVGGRVVGVIK